MLYTLEDAKSGKIVYETFPDEIVVVDLRRGSYFSITKTGVDIWSALQTSVTVGDVVDRLEQVYSGDRAEMEKAVTDFLQELQNEQLILTSETPLARPAVEAALPSKGEKVAWETPAVDKYIDMEEMLAVDPVHEVGPKGWPEKKTQ